MGQTHLNRYNVGIEQCCTGISNWLWKWAQAALKKPTYTHTHTHTNIQGKCQSLLSAPSNICSSRGSGVFNTITDIFVDYSGIRPSKEGEVRRSRALSVSTSTVEGDGEVSRSRAVSDSFKRSPGFAADFGMSHRRFKVSQSEKDRESKELEKYKWFWGHMNRSECERRLHMEGEVGNFVVRINADGNLVFSLW